MTFDYHPQSEVVTSPRPEIMTMGFNQRDVAPNARANGGVNLFADPTLRKAFVEAFDRCGAITAVYGLRNCNDPNFHTDEHAAPPSPDYDASFIMPAYNRADAAALLDQAGYPVVKDVRRFKDGTTPLRLFISLSYGGTAYLRLAQRLQQDDARNLHIDVQIENPPGQMFNPNVPVEKAPETTGAFDIGVWREAVGPDPADNLGGSGWVSANIPSVQNPDGANFLGLIDPWIVAQDQLARQALEDDQRVPVYKQMVRHVTEQLDFLPLLFDADTTLVKPTLCNFTKWPADGGYLWNMADWYLARGPTCP